MHTDLEKENTQLKEQVTDLQQQIEASDLKIGYLENRNKLLENRVLQLLRQRYGQKSEKIDPNQLKLFQELVDEASHEVEAEFNERAYSSTIDYEEPDKRKKKRRGRTPLPKRLKRKRICHEPSAEELT